MYRLLPVLSALFLTASVYGQTPVDVGTEVRPDTYTELADGTAAFIDNFQPTDVGFLHVYIDPSVDPLETYLLRGVTMSADALALLPTEFQEMAPDTSKGKFFATVAMMGIEENLYLTRFVGPTRSQIDMFAVRDGEVEHLKTLAYLDCGTPGNCAQMDSYLTDLNLDTTFDLVEISRKNAQDSEPVRHVYTMPRATKMWTETEELEVPWEGITFYEHPSAARNH